MAPFQQITKLLPAGESVQLAVGDIDYMFLFSATDETGVFIGSGNGDTGGRLIKGLVLNNLPEQLKGNIYLKNLSGSANTITLCVGSGQMFDGRFNLDATSSIPVVGPLTDTQLRASAVPVSGPLTDTQLRASPVPILPSEIGAHANAWNAAVVGVGGDSAIIDTRYCPFISIFGNTSAATTLTAWLSQDGVNFYSSNHSITGTGSIGNSFQIGARYIRLRSSAAATITATVAGKG